ncbi:MAG: DUF4294 domain-containing protein [Bacteroidota bacterium]
MLKHRHLIILAVFVLVIMSFSGVQAQIADTVDGKPYYVLEGAVNKGDTIGNVDIEEVVVFPDLEFDSKRERRKYRKLVKDLKKVYPYALKARNQLIEMEWEFRKLETEKERKEYVKKVEKELKADFKEDLKKLTITQGRLLLKLIDRETGRTSYTLLHEIKGGFSAVFWQTLARVFGHDLKADYEPHGDDRLIERIVVLIEHNQI